MSTPHKATAEQWSDAGAFASDTRACLLELRARVEALEREAAMDELRAASAEARPAPFDEAENDRRFEQAKAIIDQPTSTPASSLVERVADAIVTKATSAGIVDDRPARAAIREVAAWLRDRGGYPWAWVAQMLELEANR